MGDGEIDFLDGWSGAKFRIPNEKMEQATKYPNVVDFEKYRCKKSAFIQPRMGPDKFAV